jgi:2-methylcitrate dehydratase PrpD
MERVADQAVQKLLDLVDMEKSPRFDAAFPTMRGAAIMIETHDGRRLYHEQPTRRGSPSFPMSDEEIDDKFIELATPQLGDAGWLLAYLREIGDAAVINFPLRA